MRPGEGLASGGIGTNNILEFTLAAGEFVIRVGCGHVISAPQKIESVLAVVRRGNSGVTDLDAEDAGTDEVVPAGSLEQGGVVLCAGKTARVDETANGVTEQISTVGIELSSSIITSKTDTSLVEVSSNLDVSAGLHELSTSDGTGGHDTSTMACL